LIDVNYWPAFAGKPGSTGSSPGKPVGVVPAPILVVAIRRVLSRDNWALLNRVRGGNI
jgi:hypothetical protein